MPGPSPVVLSTRDGVRLVGDHWPTTDRHIGVVLAHGFTGHARNADVQRIARGLHEQGFGVLVPDLRGHGRSGGRSTAGADERFDIAAAVHWLRGAGYGAVATVGFSMGATATLRHAGLDGDTDAVVSVSAPGMWFERGTRPMRLVHWMFEHPAGRATVRLLRNTRVSPDGGWEVTPEAPGEVAAAIAPRPLLLVHGDDDHYFPLRHLDELSAAAPRATRWIESGMGHAELATTDDLVLRIGGWLRSAIGSRPAICHDERRD